MTPALSKAPELVCYLDQQNTFSGWSNDTPALSQTPELGWSHDTPVLSQTSEGACHLDQQNSVLSIQAEHLYWLV
jgi:hypothetical protein